MIRILFVLFLVVAVCSAQASGHDQGSCDSSVNTSASRNYRGGHGNTRASNVSKLPIRSLLYSGSQTKIYVRYMPWFGDPHHRDVGYRSDDPQQVSQQVADMLSRGIQGAIVDWYGPDSGAKNQSTMLLMKEAERQNFEFGISEDAGALADCDKHHCDLTGQLVSDLRYAADHFESSPAYIQFDGRPAIFFFGLEKYSIDWRRVRQSLALNPLLFFRNSGAFTNPDADGAYAWIAPETAGSNDPMALQYLQRFYSKAQQSQKIVMGAAYKGFNDADASWGKGRMIDHQCGQTWLATFATVGKFYSSEHQLPALIIPTWNDYEEGTEIETGIDNCVSVQASIANAKLSWAISDHEKTIDHISIFARNGSRWTEVSRPPARSLSIPLRDLSLPPQANAVCVQATGRASMLNHSSGPVELPVGKTPKSQKN